MSRIKNLNISLQKYETENIQRELTVAEEEPEIDAGEVETPAVDPEGDC